MENLLLWDVQLFLKINEGLSSSFLDSYLVPIRHIYFWIPFYVILLIYALYCFRKQVWIWIFGLCLTLMISDTCSSRIIKNTVQRPRPCQSIDLKDYVQLRADCGTGYAFTSSHATNHMAFGVFLFMTLGLLSKQWRWLYIFWAVAIGFAQIYAGLHYPLDVLCGFGLGWFLAYMYIKFTAHTRLDSRRYFTLE